MKTTKEAPRIPIFSRWSAYFPHNLILKKVSVYLVTGALCSHVSAARRWMLTRSTAGMRLTPWIFPSAQLYEKYFRLWVPKIKLTLQFTPCLTCARAWFVYFEVKITVLPVLAFASRPTWPSRVKGSPDTIWRDSDNTLGRRCGLKDEQLPPPLHHGHTAQWPADWRRPGGIRRGVNGNNIS